MTKARFSHCVPRGQYDHESSIPNPVVMFLLWAAKSDLRILRSCAPWSKRTQVARGFFVTFTAAWATVAAHYFLTTTVALSSEAVVAGSFSWGLMIFMFDRELVGHWSRNSLWVRVTVSAALSITIAIPVEMRIFQGRIDQQISRQHADENSAASSRLLQRQQAVDEQQHDLEKQLSNVRGQIRQAGENKEAEVVGRMIVNETTGVAGKGPAYEAAEERVRLLKNQQGDIENELKGLANDRNRIVADYRNEEISSVHDFLTRFEAMKAATPVFSPMWMLSWLITIVFVVIDMVPVLMKVVFPSSDHDHLVAIQVKENIHRAEKIAAYNECVTDEDFLSPRPSTLELFERIFGPDREREEENVAA
jgi:hypothetical protein